MQSQHFGPQQTQLPAILGEMPQSRQQIRWAIGC
jgi:hypothetical protein